MLLEKFGIFTILYQKAVVRGVSRIIFWKKTLRTYVRFIVKQLVFKRPF